MPGDELIRKPQTVATHAITIPAPPAGDLGAVEEAARLLVNAETPVILGGDLGDTQKSIDLLVELAETLQAPVSGGGLIAGIATAVKGLRPSAQVIGAVLNAVFLDLIEQDAQTLVRINRLLAKLRGPVERPEARRAVRAVPGCRDRGPAAPEAGQGLAEEEGGGGMSDLSPEAQAYAERAQRATEDAIERRDRQAAEYFRAKAEKAGVRRVIYLGGLGESGTELSEHLASRLEVAPGAVDLEHVGLNHLSWERAARVDGVDRLPELLRDHGALLAERLGLPEPVLHRLGVVPSYYLRYFYAANLGPTPEDIDLSLKDFRLRVNGELVNNIGNLANRSLTMLAGQFEGRLAPASPEGPGRKLVEDALARVVTEGDQVELVAARISVRFEESVAAEPVVAQSAPLAAVHAMS